MRRGRRMVLGTLFGAILLAVTLVGIEVLSSFYVPDWPARALNPRPPAPVRILQTAYKNQPWIADPDNSWAMRDIERTVAKPPGTRRAVFIGDSFVESWFTPLSLPAAVQQRLPGGANSIEAVNLGVAATGFFDFAPPRQQGEQEYLLDWMFGTLMSWEARDFEVAKSREDAARMAGKGQVEATFSWIEATDRLLRKRGVPLLVFLAPVGGVDPDYAEFWKPWPRIYSYNYICDEWHSQLAASLAKAGMRYVDLRENLANVPGTYRKLDGHWSQKGEAIVADRVAAELRSVLGDRAVAKTK